MPQFGDNPGILANVDALKDSWTPDALPEREDELEEIHYTIEPASRGYTPSNAFIYGKAGAGKTVATELKLNELDTYIQQADDVDTDLHTYFVNCADLKSSYQVAGEILKEISPGMSERPRGHGLSTIFDQLFTRIDEIGGTIVLVLDEIDVIGDDDVLLYKLTRAEANGDIDDARLSVIGISNDFDFRSKLSPKVKDTLCEDEISFAPYDAGQLRAILRRRADIAFQDGALTDDVIPLCAAYAAQNDGSARQGIRLLHKSGRIAHSKGDEQVTEEHVREAQDEIEKSILQEGLETLTTQDHASLLAIASLEAKGETPARTKKAYAEYRRVVDTIDIDENSRRTVIDDLQALSLYSFLSATKRTGGRPGGEYFIYDLDMDLDSILSVLGQNDRYSGVLSAIEMNAKKNGVIQ